MPFDLELKSYQGNCDLCWKKSNRKLLTILKENPEYADWWRVMENKYENKIPVAAMNNSKIKPPIRFYRNNESVDDLIEDAQFPFDAAEDESKAVSAKETQGKLWDINLDENFGCVESCEAF